MASAPTSRAICEISGTSTCSSLVHRQTRELKSRWRMRWAALEETIKSEHDYRTALRLSLDHIICKAKSARKIKKHRGIDTNWMEIHISSMLIRSFLTAVWCDPEAVDDLKYEMLTLDSYYGEKLKYLPSAEGIVDIEAIKGEVGGESLPLKTGSAPVVEVPYENTIDTGDTQPMLTPAFEDHVELITAPVSIPELDQSNWFKETRSTSTEEATPLASGSIYQTPILAQSVLDGKSLISKKSTTDQHEYSTAIDVPSFSQTKIDLVMVQDQLSPDTNTIVTLQQSKANEEAQSENITPAHTSTAALGWYQIPPEQRHGMEDVYPWTFNIDYNGSPPRKRLKEVVNRSENSVTCESPLSCGLPAGSVVAGDYIIRARIRAEANFAMYEARALFYGRHTYILTVIRNPRELIEECKAQREIIQSLQEQLQKQLEARRHINEMIQLGYEEYQLMMESFDSSFENTDIARKEDNELYQEWLGFLEEGEVLHETLRDIVRKCNNTKLMLDTEHQNLDEKGAHAQRKYIIKLIKKRQASETYLDMFLFEGLIWTVQSQSQPSPVKETHARAPRKDRTAKDARSAQHLTKHTEPEPKYVQPTMANGDLVPSHCSEQASIDERYRCMKEQEQVDQEEEAKKLRIREKLRKLEGEFQAQSASIHPLQTQKLSASRQKSSTASSTVPEMRKQRRNTSPTAMEPMTSQEKAKRKKWKPKNQQNCKGISVTPKLESGLQILVEET